MPSRVEGCASTASNARANASRAISVRTTRSTKLRVLRVLRANSRCVGHWRVRRAHAASAFAVFRVMSTDRTTSEEDVMEGDDSPVDCACAALLSGTAHSHCAARMSHRYMDEEERREEGERRRRRSKRRRRGVGDSA